MTTLTAPASMLAIHEIKIGQGAARIIEQMRNYPKRVKPLRPVKGASTVPTVSLRKPTPEREAKAQDIVESASPPFNTQIVSVYQRYAKQLGRDVVLVLDQFYELAQRAGSQPRMSAKYDGITVDQSRTSFSHVTEAQRASIEDYNRMLGEIGESYRRLIQELVLEEAIVGERARSYAEIGRELCGYSQDQPCRAAAVAALRLLAWRIQELMGGKVPVRRTSRA